MGDQPFARPIPTNRTTQTQNKRIQTSMPQVGLESAIPVFERSKKVHALDRVANAIGIVDNLYGIKELYLAVRISGYAEIGCVLLGSAVSVL
jgi:hypothetical protein